MSNQSEQVHGSFPLYHQTGSVHSQDCRILSRARDFPWGRTSNIGRDLHYSSERGFISFKTGVTLRFNLPGIMLYQAESVFTRNEFLLPSFYLFSSRKRQCFHHSINQSRQIATRFVYIITATRIADDFGGRIVAIFIRLRSNCKLGYLLGRLIALQPSCVSPLHIGEHNPDVPELSSWFSLCWVLEGDQSGCDGGGHDLCLLYSHHWSSGDKHLTPVRHPMKKISHKKTGKTADTRTIESKHCVQSSRYTTWDGEGGVRSVNPTLACAHLQSFSGSSDLLNGHAYRSPSCRKSKGKKKKLWRETTTSK